MEAALGVFQAETALVASLEGILEASLMEADLTAFLEVVLVGSLMEEALMASLTEGEVLISSLAEVVQDRLCR